MYLKSMKFGVVVNIHSLHHARQRGLDLVLVVHDFIEQGSLKLLPPTWRLIDKWHLRIRQFMWLMSISSSSATCILCLSSELKLS